MFDLHLIPYSEWGVRPVLFYIGSIPVPSYSFFILLAIIVGCLVYWLEARKQKKDDENSFYLIIAALIGGAIGAKLPIIFLYWNDIIASFPDLTLFWSGRTIVGGIIGGIIAVLYTKYKLGIKTKRGNFFAPAIALGMAIGRIGCFLRGCCYGKTTELPWGVNFGDGILRHPTQLYESLFMLGMFFYLKYLGKKNPKPGRLFDILMVYYFTFRFFIEFLRVEKVVFLGLTLFQLLSILVVIWFSRRIWKSK